jgi:hypothetical protein
MGGHDILLGLMRAYCGGDLLAKRALIDFLEEVGDARVEDVRREDIDWNAVALELCDPPSHGAYRRSFRQAGGESVDHPDLPQNRFYVDCARFNASATPDVIQAVRAAREQWLQRLFPEIELRIEN